MRVLTDVQTMKKALAAVKPAVSKRGRLPALCGAYISANGGRTTVRASNLDLSIETELAGEVAEEGVVVVPHDLLAKLVVKGKGPLEIRTDGEHVRVQNGSLSSLRALPAEEFPRAYVGHPGSVIRSFPLDLDGLAKVIMAASKDEARPILTGVLFRGSEMVATDSYRLHLVRQEGVDFGADGLLLPAKALATVVKNGKPATLEIVDVAKTRHVRRTNGEPEFFYPMGGYYPRDPNAAFKAWMEDETYLEPEISVASGTTRWWIRSIDGEFPNYNQLIPPSQPLSFTVGKAEFVHAVEQVKTLACDSEPVRLRFTTGADTVKVTAITRDVGEAETDVPLSSPWGYDNFAIAFNPDFLVDAVQTGFGDRFAMTCTDGLKPAMAVDVDGDRTALRLLMPVRVS